MEVFVSLFLFSCSTDDFQESKVDKNVIRGHHPSTVIKYGDLFTSSKAKAPTTRAIDYSTTDSVVTHGCDRTESKKKATVSLNFANASKFGLPSGLYVVEYLECFKDIHIGDKMFFEMYSPNCGYKPGQDFSLGNHAISITKKRGYVETKGGTGILSTFVFHIISDISGKSYNRYAPCAPSNLEWIYEIVNI